MTLFLLVITLFPLIGVVSIFSFWKRQLPAPVQPTPSHTPAIEERRQSHRRGVTPVIVQVRSAPGSEAKFEGLVLDVSRGGLGLSLKQPVEAGTVVEIRPAAAAPSVPWTQVEVRHCSTMASRWKFGCRFIQEPEPQVRALFG